MLKPTTYSMCCHFASSPHRLAIFALPATAPIAGSANGCTSLPTVVGSNTVSPSIITISPCRAAAIPVLSAAALPAFSCRITRTAGRPRASSAVLSVEPSSTTMISIG